MQCVVLVSLILVSFLDAAASLVLTLSVCKIISRIYRISAAACGELLGLVSIITLPMS